MKYPSIFLDVFQSVELEKTKIGRKAFNEMNEERILNIIVRNGVFWFECNKHNHPSNSVYKYLIAYIKRKFKLQYLHESI